MNRSLAKTRSMQKLLCIVAAAVACLGIAGCSKSESRVEQSTGQMASNRVAEMSSRTNETILRIHWLGKKRVAADTNSHDLMAVWNLSESDHLEAQTINKLSRAPWSIRHLSVQTNAADALRPLLKDILEEEFYFETSAGVQPGTEESVLAVRLSPERADLWKTNLAFISETLTGLHPASANSGSRWSLKKHDFPNLIDFVEAGDWTLVGIAQDKNQLLAEIAHRIGSNGNPSVAPSVTNTWLEINGNLLRLAQSFFPDSAIPTNAPKFHLLVNGTGEFVRINGDLEFPQKLGLELNSWTIPTNLIRGELSTITAVRGLQKWLNNFVPWQKLKLGAAPDQLYFWGLSGLPAQIYCSAPDSDASNRVNQIATRLLALSLTNDLAGFQRSPWFHGVTWKGLPYLYPFVRSIDSAEGSFVEAGTVVVEGNNALPQPELIEGISSRTNLVYYDREFTGGQIGQWIFIGQFVRFVSHWAQLPNDSAGLLWLKAAAPRVGSSATDISLTSPSRLSFSRTSGIGFTAIELNLLVDWLESPEFPIGLHTFRARPGTLP
jgi:hypothetical protein